MLWCIEASNALSSRLCAEKSKLILDGQDGIYSYFLEIRNLRIRNPKKIPRSSELLKVTHSEGGIIRANPLPAAYRAPIIKIASILESVIATSAETNLTKRLNIKIFTFPKM
jgi:hypothetical protein